MLKSSLLEILRSFSKEDLVRFKDFVKSPYHNKNSNAEKLFTAVKKFAPAFDDPLLAKEEVWKKIFPGKNYNYGIMKNLIHELTKLAEEFIKTENYNRNRIRNDYNLCFALYQRNLVKALNVKFTAFEKKYEVKNYISSGMALWEYYACLSDFHALKAYITLAYLPVPDAEPELITESYYNISSLLLRALHTMANNKVGKLIGKNNFKEINLVEDFLRYLTPVYIEDLISKLALRSAAGARIINCYYLMYRALNNDMNEENYFKFKNAVTSAAADLSAEDFRVLIRCLTISLGGLARSHINMHREMYEINNLMLENNIFLEENGHLKEIHFNKYVSYCCTCRELISAEKFINRYAGKLPFANRASCENYAHAELCFAKDEYHKSLENLSKVNILYFDMKFTAKSLEMMNYYMLDDYESFLYVLDSSKHLAKNTKELELELTKYFKYFYELVNALFRFRKDPAAIDLSAMKKEVESAYPYRKVWLLEKIEVLKAGD